MFTPRHLRVIPVVAACGLLTLTGCGSSQEFPAKVAEDFLHALAEKDAEGACELMAEENTPASEDEAIMNQCLGGVHSIFGSEDFAEEMAGYENAKVESVEIDGNEAEMPEEAVTGVLEPNISLELRLINEKWYVSDMS